MLFFTPDQAGNLGEWIAAVALSRPAVGKNGRPLFRPVFLGEKYPTADLLIDVLGKNGRSLGFFFVQVRSSAATLSNDGRLKINVDHETYKRLAQLPIPSYIVGVDIVHESTYVVAGSKRRKTGISSMTRAFNLRDDAVKLRLYKEVSGFWNRRAKPAIPSEFNDV
jgi:hypothetical protein